MANGKTTTKDRMRNAAAQAAEKRRAPKKKASILSTERITYIDYKDVNLLRRFMSERAKIRARRVTGNDVKQQREIAKAIRIAREMALLPYAVRQVTSRGKGGRGRDRGDRPGRDREEATLEMADVTGAGVDYPAEYADVAAAYAASSSDDAAKTEA
jgi:small subunit ribosomal protein S18